VRHATRIEKTLSKVPGATKAIVNLASEKANVTYHPNQVTIEELINRIEKTGYGVVGGHFYKDAYKALRGGSANMAVLVAMGTSAAYFYSLVLALSGNLMGLYFEASAIIITLIVLG
jgi:cation transport ATPase